MTLNAAGLNVRGANNPRWLGGPLKKVCAHCGRSYVARRAQARSRFCSLQCWGVAQRGQKMPKKVSRQVQRQCETCGRQFSVLRSRIDRQKCCSTECAAKYRSRIRAGANNANWNGGLSRLPYPWDFRIISRRIIERDQYKCLGPECNGRDWRLTAHHINYDKTDCRDENLITLCSSCNSKANFGRERWQAIYAEMVRAKKHGGGWEEEDFSRTEAEAALPLFEPETTQQPQANPF